MQSYESMSPEQSPIPPSAHHEFAHRRAIIVVATLLVLVALGAVFYQLVVGKWLKSRSQLRSEFESARIQQAQSMFEQVSGGASVQTPADQKSTAAIFNGFQTGQTTDAESRAMIESQAQKNDDEFNAWKKTR